jgi:hypothetical protein
MRTVERKEKNTEICRESEGLGPGRTAVPGPILTCERGTAALGPLLMRPYAVVGVMSAGNTREMCFSHYATRSRPRGAPVAVRGRLLFNDAQQNCFTQKQITEQTRWICRRQPEGHDLGISGRDYDA